MILLIAYGHAAYAKFASNLSKSIKFFCDIEITLASDGCHVGYDMSSIDKIIPFNPAEYDNDPCLVKINLNKISPYDKTIYMDVDMLCITDPSVFFGLISEGDFWIDCLRQTDENWWMTGKAMAKYGCSDIFNDVNSSVICFDKSPEYWEKLNSLYHKINKRDLKNTWGKRHFIPDEVLHSCVLDYPLIPRGAVSYCDHDKIKEESCFISMYGFGIAKPVFREAYDKTMKLFQTEYYPLSSIYKHKFVGN